MSKQISCSVQWFVPAFMLFLFAQTALCQVEPAVNSVLESLKHAVNQDDNEAYRAARTAALELEDREFDVLLETLDKTGTWQALAVKGGLRVRRENPDLAAEFDRQLDLIRDNPTQMADVTWGFIAETLRKEFATSESDWLRYETVLTEKTELPPDGSGLGLQLPGWIQFRRSVFRTGTHNKGNMRIWIKMYQDKPEWIQWHEITRWFPHVAKRAPGLVDEYVPELLEIYMRFHLKSPDALNPNRWRPANLNFESHTRTRTYIDLLQAITEADTPVALPALKQLREFEQTIREEIQTQAILLQARLQEIEELREQALREGREEDARKLIIERQELQARDVVTLDASQLRAIRRTLDEQIEKHREAVELP